MTVRHRALLYARISQVQTGAETSPTVQLERCMRMALERGRTVDPLTDIYADTEKGQHSAFTRENIPQWNRLELRALTDPEIADIIIDDLDRGWRNTRVLLNFENKLKETGVKLVFVASGEVETDSPTGMLQFTMKGLLAEMHARDTSYRIKTRHYDPMRARGLYLGHQAPPGLKRTGNRFDMKLIAGPQLPIILEFMRLYLKDYGTPAAAVELERRGMIPSGFTSRWRTKFKKVLNELQWYRGVVDPVLLESVRAERDRRSEAHNRTRRPKRHDIPILWQLLTCAVCGHKYTINTVHAPYGRGVYTNFAHLRLVECDGGVGQVSALKADKQAYAWLARLRAIPAEVRDQAAEIMARGPGTEDRGPDVDTQIAKLEQRLIGYEQMRADGDIPRDKFREIKADIERQIGELNARLRSPVNGPKWTYDGARAFIDQLLATDFSSVGEREPEAVNRLLRTICKRVTVARGTPGKHKFPVSLTFELQPDFEWLGALAHGAV